MAMHFDARSSESAVFCNGILHWIRHSHYASLLSRDDEFLRRETDVSQYFDLPKERLGLVSSTPPLPLLVKNITATWPRLRQRYFGESAGHLYLIETYQHWNTQFDVMEMERDYSGWFVKYHVDLNPLGAAFPGLDWNAFVVLGLFPENGVEEDNSTHLLLHLPGKIISYNLRNETFKTSVELAHEKLYLAFGDNHGIQDYVTFPYMETLACYETMLCYASSDPEDVKCFKF
ncbi:hypothetical protein ACLB2K_001096 [Fragaria x ananassa]